MNYITKSFSSKKNHSLLKTTQNIKLNLKKYLQINTQFMVYS